MAAFNINLRKSSEDPKKVQVTPTTTVRELKAQEGLKGHGFFFKKSLKDADTMENLGIIAEETISVFKTGPTPGQHATLRLKKGDTKRSYNHAQLHAASTSTVVGAVMGEGQRVADKVDQVKEDTSVIRNIFEGGEIPRKEGQSDQDHLGKLRLQKRALENQIIKLNEKEKIRVADAKRGRYEKVTRAAEVADGNVEFVTSGMEGATIQDKKAAEVVAHQARMKLLKEAERKEKQELAKAAGPKAKAKGKVKGKAKAKAKAQPPAEEHDEEAMDFEQAEEKKDGQDPNEADASEVGSLVQEPPPSCDVAGTVAAFNAGEIVAQEAEKDNMAKAAEDGFVSGAKVYVEKYGYKHQWVINNVWPYKGEMHADVEGVEGGCGSYKLRELVLVVSTPGPAIEEVVAGETDTSEDGQGDNAADAAKAEEKKDDDADDQSQISTEAGSGKSLSDVEAKTDQAWSFFA